MKMSSWKIIYILLLSLFLYSCSYEFIVEPQPVTNNVLESFRTETGIGAVYVVDTSLLNTVISWQGHGDYPGVDDWTTAKVPNTFDLYGGLPGQSEYYTIDQTLVDSDTIQFVYWESLQVKKHPEFGYRSMVGVFEIRDSIIVAIAKTLANPQYGDGGAWQIYVENFNDVLSVFDTIYLIKENSLKITSTEYAYWENTGK